ncbi:MAG TPA: aspartate aminotransferase family protein [Gammaproteobacteria bacterium]|nr:aspartate aminotransferase family protein [Gammaproteobacteria bacterium]
MPDHLMANYARLPVAFVKGDGPWLRDTQDNLYLDALSGIGVCGLGHAHPAVTQALSEQAATLVHTSNLYGIPLQEKLAARLCEVSGMERAFFCNSGAEAVEAAIKVARLQGHRRGIREPAIIVMENAFHGRTLATLTATGNRRVQAGFEPLVKGFIRAPYGDIEALELIAGNSTNVVAVLLEPVQGEGGINLPPDGYLAAVRRFCDRQGWLLMLDEIQTGMGRTGRWFACQHEEVVPDVLCVAKGLGNGVPIGACLARGEAAETFTPGSHGSTFGGNPLACRAALAVMEVIEKEGLLERAGILGESILCGLREKLSDCPRVRDIRGRGLMLGIELEGDCSGLVGLALQHRLLLSVQGGRVVRLLPPLILSDEEAYQIVTILDTVIREFIATV